MEEGLYRLSCLFCGNNRPLKSSFSLKNMTIPPNEYTIFSLRSRGAGPGRGHKGVAGAGLKTIERISLKEGLLDPRFQGIAEQIRGRLIEIVKDYLENDIITLEDLQ